MIAEIRLQQYRSYLDQTFKLQPGVNVVVGPNASGKTNLLEAIMVACQGGSYRAADSELITHNKNWARIDLTTINKDVRTVKITNQHKSDIEFIISGKRLKRLGYNHQLPLVFFEPNHLQLLFGPPELRRNYLDGILDQIKPGYKKNKHDYLKSLRQRNALLKSGQANTDNIFPWNIRLSQLGGFLATSRIGLVKELNEQINVAYRSLSNDTANITLTYSPSVLFDQYESLLLRKLEASYELDNLRGYTAVGPHREDFATKVNNKQVSTVASRGESRTIIIALKAIETDILKNYLSKTPLILFDDVFSELDINRRSGLTKFLMTHQSVITTTNADYLSSSLTNTIRLN